MSANHHEKDERPRLMSRGQLAAALTGLATIPAVFLTPAGNGSTLLLLLCAAYIGWVEHTKN